MRAIIGLCVLGLVLAVAGCGSSSDPAPAGTPSEGLAIQVPRSTMVVGDSQTATVKRMMCCPAPASACDTSVMVTTSKPRSATDPESGVTWISYDTDVVSVDASGKVTAVGKGKTYLAATMHSSDGTKVLSVAITVTVQ